jgi:hypothetical protein
MVELDVVIRDDGLRQILPSTVDAASAGFAGCVLLPCQNAYLPGYLAGLRLRAEVRTHEREKENTTTQKQNFTTPTPAFIKLLPFNIEAAFRR